MDFQFDALVIGLGSTLRGDDAIGRIASQQVRTLIDPQRVNVISQCAATPELAAEMSQARVVVFLDASVDGPRDQVVIRELTVSDSIDPLAHRLDATSLLGLCKLLYDVVPTVYAITFRGESFDLRDEELTSAARAASESIAQETIKLIGGIKPPKQFQN